MSKITGKNYDGAVSFVKKTLNTTTETRGDEEYEPYTKNGFMNYEKEAIDKLKELTENNDDDHIWTQTDEEMMKLFQEVKKTQKKPNINTASPETSTRRETEEKYIPEEIQTQRETKTTEQDIIQEEPAIFETTQRLFAQMKEQKRKAKENPRFFSENIEMHHQHNEDEHEVHQEVGHEEIPELIQEEREPIKIPKKLFELRSENMLKKAEMMRNRAKSVSYLFSLGNVTDRPLIQTLKPSLYKNEIINDQVVTSSRPDMSPKKKIEELLKSRDKKKINPRGKIMKTSRTKSMSVNLIERDTLDQFLTTKLLLNRPESDASPLKQFNQNISNFSSANRQFDTLSKVKEARKFDTARKAPVIHSGGPKSFHDIKTILLEPKPFMGLFSTVDPQLQRRPVKKIIAANKQSSPTKETEMREKTETTHSLRVDTQRSYKETTTNQFNTNEDRIEFLERLDSKMKNSSSPVSSERRVFFERPKVQRKMRPSASESKFKPSVEALATRRVDSIFSDNLLRDSQFGDKNFA